MSKQRHEINYTGGKVARSAGASRPAGKRAVKRAKRETGTVSRKRVERRAREIARPGSSGTTAKSNQRGATSRRGAPSRTSRGGTARKSTARTGTAKTRKSGGSKKVSRLTRMTTDHEEIRRWAEERGGRPAAVKRTGRNSDVGIIRIDFPGYSGGKTLKEISWDEFFEKFEESKLALVHQEETAGGERSNFNKLVKRK